MVGAPEHEGKRAHNAQVVAANQSTEEERAQTALAMNTLASAQRKQQLLQDIMMDMRVCEIEGWDKWAYIQELQDLLNSFGPPPKKA